MRLQEVELVERDASALGEDGAGPYAPKPTKFRIDLASIWAGAGGARMQKASIE